MAAPVHGSPLVFHWFDYEIPQCSYIEFKALTAIKIQKMSTNLGF